MLGCGTAGATRWPRTTLSIRGTTRCRQAEVFSDRWFTDCGKLCGASAGRTPRPGWDQRSVEAVVEDPETDLGTVWRTIVRDLQPNQRAWLRASR